VLAISASSYGLVSSQATNSSSTSNSSSSGTPSTASLTAGLSSGCQVAAGNLLSTQFATCSNLIGLVSLVSAQGGLLVPLTNWITGTCSANPCSNDTISSTLSALNSGCGSDVQKGVPAAIALNTVISNYNPIRDLLCTQYASNSSYCVPSIVGNVQNATGRNFTVTEILGIVSGRLSDLSLSSIPSGTYCNDCGHALFTKSNSITVNTGTSNVSTASNGSSEAVAKVCGASFNDGRVPDSVRVAGSPSRANAQNAGEQTKASLLSIALMSIV
ncbi:hypothetical protein PPACK8108_LOCUS7008, partial [Phakopsora pachyrhizi]